MPILKHNRYTRKQPLVSSQSGFSLIEVMIAALVISVGMLGLAGLQLVSMKGSHQSYLRHQATFLVQDVVERIRANPSQIAFYNGFNTDTGGFNCPAAKDCSTAFCSPADIVAYDKSNMACGLGQRLNNGKIRIACNLAACASNDIQVEVSWTERQMGKETLDVSVEATKGRTDNIILNTVILGP